VTGNADAEAGRHVVASSPDAGEADSSGAAGGAPAVDGSIACNPRSADPFLELAPVAPADGGRSLPITVCGGVRCDWPVASSDMSVLSHVEACCVAEGGTCGRIRACGVHFVEGGSTPNAVFTEFWSWRGTPRGCVEVAQPGELDASCPGHEVEWTSHGCFKGCFDSRGCTALPGCRRPDGTCGFWFDAFELGCIDRALVEAPGPIVCAPECSPSLTTCGPGTAPCCAGLDCSGEEGIAPYCHPPGRSLPGG
jgi:hypothetical protein